MSTRLRSIRRGVTYDGTVGLTVMVCPWAECSIAYAIPEQLRAKAQQEGNGKISWYCPNGHSVTYNGPGEEDKLREEKIRLEARLSMERRHAGRLSAERDQFKASAAAHKGVATKLKKRVANGVCPCCKRTFKDLARHMEGQHPGYGGEHGEA